MKPQKAVYAASLDPITNGHINVIERMAPLYDELIVLVAVDNRKAYAFTPEERVMLTKAAIAHLANASVDVCLGRYVVKQAQSIGASVIIRGLRNFKDLEDEQTLAEENRKICPEIETVWVPCLPHLMHVSSSMVKGHVGIDPDWAYQVARSVPAAVVAKLKEKLMVTKAKKHWATLMSTLGNPKGSAVVLEDLVARYSEPHRAYHNLEHIVAMLDELERIGETDPAIALAVWFHDAVYETETKDHPKIADNEARSAYLAELKLQVMGIPNTTIATVKDLIMATTHTVVPTDLAAKILVDLDLMVLGGSEKEFEAYEAGIRIEYSWVPESLFCRGRAVIVKSFIDRPTIYLTDWFRDKYESAARKNLERSIERLNK